MLAVCLKIQINEQFFMFNLTKLKILSNSTFFNKLEDILQQIGEIPMFTTLIDPTSLKCT